MPIVPSRDLEAIEFFEIHEVVWAGAPTTIGLTAPQVAALDAITVAARYAYDTQKESR